MLPYAARSAPLTPRQRWMLFCGLSVALYGPILALLAFRPAKWFLAQVAGVTHIFSLVSAAAVVVAVIVHVAIGHGSGSAQKSARPRKIAWPMWWAAGLVVVAEIATHIAATEVHDHIAARFPHVRELYANHDIAT